MSSWLSGFCYFGVYMWLSICGCCWDTWLLIWDSLTDVGDATILAKVVTSNIGSKLEKFNEFLHVFL